ncbi:MAG TPA: heme exporter protein CcmD [Alphaproteobacteria bacterium]|nr:heme exporter protein CcmD [Alphaproteobacteria bacterium]
MSEFFAMGGYAAFVWTAYVVAAAVMVALLVGSLRTLKERQRTLATLEGLRGGRRRTAGPAIGAGAGHDA